MLTTFKIEAVTSAMGNLALGRINAFIIPIILADQVITLSGYRETK